MSPRVTGATALRVLTQLRRDPRTIAMLVLVPCLLLLLLKYVLIGDEGAFERVGGPLAGMFPFILMFLITSITVLRERTSGTLERLLTLPLSKLDLLLGYGIAFALVATLQAVIVSAVTYGLLGIDVAGSVVLAIVLTVLNAVLGTALGLFMSAFARTEFQAVQFMPAIVFPQMLLCGLFVPRSQMSSGLETVSDFLPLTYAYDALDRVVTRGVTGSMLTLDIVVVVGSILLALALGSLTLRRRTA